MEKNNDNQEYIMIGNEKYPIKTTEVKQKNLLFWEKNPRVFSALNSGNANPTQEEIEETMCSMDHVKRLKESIKSNGGLIDPIIVREGDNVVLEGNSRLAAYRLLFKRNPIKWAKIKVTFLPKNIPESAVFTLIGQDHIIGRKDWDPYEQAGYLYRTIKESNKTPELLASELGIGVSKVNKLLNVYEYMISKGDDTPNKWSHYEELLKNRAIKNEFKNVPELEDKVIEAIKNDKIKMAIDIRKLGEICKLNDKISKKIISEIVQGEEDIYSGYDIILSSGKLDNNYQTISKFRKKITDENFANKILNDENVDEIEFELKKIEVEISKLLRKIEGGEK